MPPKRKISFVVGIAMFLAVGCVTSYPFREAAHRVGPDLASIALDYVTGDTMLADSAKTDRLAKCNRLLAATQNVRTVNRLDVASAWADVRPFLLAYIDADPVLRQDPDELPLRHTAIAKFDKLLTDDASRPLARLIPTTQTTQP